MSKTPESFISTILLLSDLLKGQQYAIRGTASLVLQGLDMIAQDIDILTDKDAALACNKLLKDYLVEEVKYKESEKFKSYYGKFKVNDIQVEIMGEWKIKDTKGNWSSPFDLSNGQRKKILLNGKEVYVTTVETELACFAKMGRWNAYHKVKREVKG